MSRKTDIKRAAEIVLKSLNSKEKEAILKGYPFRTVQRKLMRRLRRDGVSAAVLSEISGFYPSTIYRMCAARRE